MKIFNRGSEVAKDAAPAKAEPAVPVSIAQPQTAEAEPAQNDAPAEPDLTSILDANVKEMSEKIARLASTVETQQEGRDGLEAKLEQMEERMRKLSSLTEMISAQFNPFVGDAPEPREAPPTPDVGLAAPAVAPEELPPSFADAVPGPGDLSLDLDMDGPPGVEEAPQAPQMQEADEEPDHDEVPFAPALEHEEEDAPEHEAPAAPIDDIREGVHVWSVPVGYESSIVMLGWTEMLLRSTGSRESLLELVNYYHNIGWIGDPARDQLLAYADGIAAPSDATSNEGGDWRASFEVHEKSLLYVEKLKALASRRAR